MSVEDDEKNVWPEPKELMTEKNARRTDDRFLIVRVDGTVTCMLYRFAW
jgi:hypothetical protein